MTDFEKILKVTQMAKKAADVENKVFADKKNHVSLLSLAGSMVNVWEDIKIVSSMFDFNCKHTKIAMSWYSTVLRMRTVGR
jgi:hypothetical protein